MNPEMLKNSGWRRFVAAEANSRVDDIARPSGAGGGEEPGMRGEIRESTREISPFRRQAVTRDKGSNPRDGEGR
jgi:hypothetical protein